MTPDRSKRRLSNAQIGVISLILVIFGFYMAFTKALPWSGGYEIKAVVKNAQNIANKSPVRVAGVSVGKVTSVKSATDDNGNGVQAAIVTMRINNNGRPIHQDAKLQLRPRLFLEGNLFVDLQPGSPSSPEAKSGYTIPIQHTANFVQVDQFLTSQQADTRQNLQLLLKEVGDSFVKYGGAAGLREFFKSSAVAGKSTSEVNEALLGTAPHDLSNFIRNTDLTVQGLAGNNPQNLAELVTNLRTVTGSFAAQGRALETAIHTLPQVLDASGPAFAALNRSFPPLRAFARDALPGVKTAGPALDAATPWVAQLRGLVSRNELYKLSNNLRVTIPPVTALARATIPFLEQARALSNCFDQVIIPWSNSTTSPADGSAYGNVYQETGYALTGLAGESRNGDANGQYVRILGGGGNNTVSFPTPGEPTADKQVGIAPYTLLGYDPAIASSAKTPFRPDIPCETQQPPNLGTGGASPPPPQTMSRSRSLADSGFTPTMLSNWKTLTSLFGQEKQARSKGNRKLSLSLLTQIAKAYQLFSKQQPSAKQIMKGRAR